MAHTILNHICIDRWDILLHLGYMKFSCIVNIRLCITSMWIGNGMIYMEIGKSGKFNPLGMCLMGSLMSKNHDMRIDYSGISYSKLQLMCITYMGIGRVNICWLFMKHMYQVGMRCSSIHCMRNLSDRLDINIYLNKSYTCHSTDYKYQTHQHNTLMDTA